MKIPGYCTGCRKIRTVRVSSSGMAALARHGTPSGICDNCAELEDIHQSLRGRRLSTQAFDRLPPRLQDEAKAEIRRGNWERVAELLVPDKK